MKKIHYICKYTPVELLTALGYECELLDDAPARYDQAEQVAHPNLCGFGKSILEAVLAGEVEDLILVDCCDTIRSVYDILRADGRLRSLHLLDLLHGRTSAPSSGPWDSSSGSWPTARPRRGRRSIRRRSGRPSGRMSRRRGRTCSC